MKSKKGVLSSCSLSCICLSILWRATDMTSQMDGKHSISDCRGCGGTAARRVAQKTHWFLLPTLSPMRSSAPEMAAVTWQQWRVGLKWEGNGPNTYKEFVWLFVFFFSKRCLLVMANIVRQQTVGFSTVLSPSCTCQWVMLHTWTWSVFQGEDSPLSCLF